jgi:predicted membrane-bound spermidine synthase
MNDAIDAMFTVDEFTMLVVGGCVGIAFWFIREMTESFVLAAFCTPMMVAGALAANYLFRVNFVVAVQDKDSNVVIASAAGVICALVLVLVSLWISVLMSERRSEKRELAQLPTLPPSGR